MAKKKVTKRTAPRKKQLLTPRQRRFVAEYMKDLNGKQAAIRTGYSPSCADVQAARLLAYANVSAELKKRMAAREKRTEVTVDRVLKEIARLAFSDMRHHADWGPDGVKLKPSSALSEDAAAAVAEVSENRQGVRFKLYSKEQALTMLSRHLGMFHDTLQLNGEIKLSDEADEFARGISRLAARLKKGKTSSQTGHQD